jgi:hypothetical protein
VVTYFRVILAALTWATLALQFTLSIRAEGVALAFVNLLGYFTILTNIFVGLVLTLPVAAPQSALGKLFERSAVHLSAVASIVIVGAVYHALLASQWDPHGWELVSDTGLHTLVPIGFTLYWFIASPKEALSARVLRSVMVYPAAYTVYVMLRGEVLGRYPYFFIDVPTIGYVSAVRNVVGILVLLLVVASALSVLARSSSALGTPLRRRGS